MGTSEDLQQLIALMEVRGLSISQTIEIVNGNIYKLDVRGEIPLTVDYTRTVEQAVDNGGYELKSGKITDNNFPVPSALLGKRIDVIAKFFYFGKMTKTREVVAKMDKDDYHPAAPMELLTLGLLYPNLQKQFPIIALDSVWNHNDKTFVLGLGSDGYNREVDIFHSFLCWAERCRFLGIKN